MHLKRFRNFLIGTRPVLLVAYVVGTKYPSLLQTTILAMFSTKNTFNRYIDSNNIHFLYVGMCRHFQI